MRARKREEALGSIGDEPIFPSPSGFPVERDIPIMKILTKS